MDLSTALSAIALALATGMVAGYGLSVAGWVLVSGMLVVTLLAGSVVGQVEPVVALGLSVLAIIGFNAGLFVGLVRNLMDRKAAT